MSNNISLKQRTAKKPELSGLYKKRRFVSLFMLIIALAIGVGAAMIVQKQSDSEVDTQFVTILAIYVIFIVVLYLIISIWAPYADPALLPIATVLNSLGLTMIYRIDMSTSESSIENQFMITLGSIVVAALIVIFLKDPRRLRRVTYICLVVSVILLLLPMIPGLGVELNGARLWINIPGFGTFQPGEIAKITLAIFYAGYLSTNRDLILLAGKKIAGIQFPRFRDLAPMFFAWLISLAILVFQSDLGTAILLFGMFMVMIYIATSRASWIVIGLAFIALGGVIAYFLIGHVRARIDGWTNALTEESYNQAFGGSRQIIQGIFGMREGGLFGTGLAQGRPDLVPMANSDMIMTQFGEELGLIGVFAIVCIYILLISRGFRTALSARDSFSKLLASGLSFVFVLQVFVVVGGITRLIPLTGLTTPFLAAGGSSLLANWIIIALLLRISNQARQPVSTQAPISEELTSLNKDNPAKKSSVEVSGATGSLDDATVRAPDLMEEHIERETVAAGSPAGGTGTMTRGDK